MNRRAFLTSTLALPAAGLSIVHAAYGQSNVIKPNLMDIVVGKGWQVFNRNVSVINQSKRKVARFDERMLEGLAWMKDLNLSNGTIEFELRGKNVFQRSFVGLAFHGLDEKTYDAIYFRPFNFKSEDPVRRRHAVQYISHPVYTWKKLREEFPEKYERAVKPVPDPEDWFHTRVVISWPKVSVFVNDAKEPSLVVEQLSERKSGWVGLYAGANSGGDFANLKIISDK